MVSDLPFDRSCVTQHGKAARVFNSSRQLASKVYCVSPDLGLHIASRLQDDLGCVPWQLGKGPSGYSVDLKRLPGEKLPLKNHSLADARTLSTGHICWR